MRRRLLKWLFPDVEKKLMELERWRGRGELMAAEERQAALARRNRRRLQIIGDAEPAMEYRRSDPWMDGQR